MYVFFADFQGVSISPNSLAERKFYPMISSADAKAANASLEAA